MPVHVLLINPEIPSTFWSFHDALVCIGRKAAFPPLGLLTVAALLPPDWERRLVDLNARPLGADDLAWADLVMVGAMTVQRDAARRVIRRCLDAGKTVVAGGPLFTIEPEQFPEVPHLILNEAELTLPRFLEDWARGCPAPVYRTNAFADIRQSPVPQWDLIRMRDYASMSVQYSRGCPFHCEFCNVTSLLGHRPRTKSAAQILRELDTLSARGWKDAVFFVDDNLIGNKPTLAGELLPALIEWRRRHRTMPFFTEASVNLADDPHLIRLLCRAGFESVFVGIETPDENLLSASGKVQNTRRNLLDDVRTLQRAGLEVQAGFILGFDHEDPGIFQRQIAFIQKSGIAVAMVGLLQAVRGTPLHRRMEEAGRLVGGLTGDNTDGRTNIRTLMDPRVLQAGYFRVLRAVYEPENYYGRVRAFLKEYRVPRIRAPLNARRIWAAVRSVLLMGLGARGWQAYWRLMMWTAFARPRALPRAFTLAIYGRHFHRVFSRLAAGLEPVPE